MRRLKPKILLVEDEYKTGEMFKRALETEDLDIEWITNGTTALENIEKGKYDLVILDLKVPGLSGEEVLSHLRKIDPYVIVVVYTNYLEPEVMKRLINLGVDAYINKGPDADLWETVEIIKSKIAPFTEEQVRTLLGSTPNDFLKLED